MAQDKVSYKAEWEINKFKDPTGKIGKFLQQGGSIEEAIKQFGIKPKKEVIPGNVGLNEGLQTLIDAICSIGTTTKWDAANARLGVGDSNAAPAPTQTGLQAAVNKAYKGMDSGYPQRSGQIAIWRSTFIDGEAQYAWEEYTVVNAANDTGSNLNRATSSKGTKVAGESWTLELRITFS